MDELFKPKDKYIPLYLSMILGFWALFCSALHAQDFLVKSETDILHQKLKLKLERESKSGLILKKSKYALINGDVELAKSALARELRKDQWTHPLIRRYLAIIATLNNRPEESLDHLAALEGHNWSSSYRLCPLKVINLLELNQMDQAQAQWISCKETAGLHIAPQDALEHFEWWDLILLSGDINYGAISFQNLTANSLERILKRALYRDEHQLLLKQIDRLPDQVLGHAPLRELMAILYFKELNLKRAYQLMEGLDSSNIRNLRGALYTGAGQLEKAYIEHKLALSKKNNSLNALQSLIPLAFLLKEYQEGEKLSQMLLALCDNCADYRPWKILFTAKNADYARALELLKLHDRQKASLLPDPGLEGLRTLLLARTSNKRQAKTLALELCSQGRALFCWVNMNLNLDEELSVASKGQSVPLYEKYRK